MRRLALDRELLASRGPRPVVDRTFPLDDVVDAYRYVETEQKLGTVVITVTCDGGAGYSPSAGG
ncbi:MAG: zinc-binding dehydrogenase [Actinomycetota bacterium]